MNAQDADEMPERPVMRLWPDTIAAQADAESSESIEDRLDREISQNDVAITRLREELTQRETRAKKLRLARSALKGG